MRTVGSPETPLGDEQLMIEVVRGEFGILRGERSGTRRVSFSPACWRGC